MEKTTADKDINNKNNSKDEFDSDLERNNNTTIYHWSGIPLCKFQGFWCPTYLVRAVTSFQRNFKANDTDVIIASVPKSGTTWTKALVFSIVNRSSFSSDQSPLLSMSTYKIVPSLECQLFAVEDDPNLETLAQQPRIFTSHLPYQALVAADSVGSKSKIVYVSRNPLDQLISERYFFKDGPMVPEGVTCGEILPLEKSLNRVCDGELAFGPYWDHLLGYWNASLENPDKVLFLKYEDMKKDPTRNVKKIAEFLNMPFSEQEERQGLVEEIEALCSFNKLKNLDVNKEGVLYKTVNNSAFYRKGEAGDWKNHFTVEHGEKMKKILEDKFEGSGLTIDII